MKQWKSPAKINLYLAVPGIRSDGFHEIDSIVAQLDFGDDLWVSPILGPVDQYDSDVSGLAFDDSNLIYRALQLYRQRTGFRQSLNIRIEKKIPMGAGLGGGSSNAATILRILDEMNPDPVGRDVLMLWSAELGSDCPLFFNQGISRIRGRGEIVVPFSCVFKQAALPLRILLVHPGFGISAGWAYTTLRESFSDNYGKYDEVASEIESWKTREQPWLVSHRNDLSLPVDSKYLAVATLKSEFMKEFQKTIFMSGSGSSCFCFLDGKSDGGKELRFVKKCWGDNIFHRVCLIC